MGDEFIFGRLAPASPAGLSFVVLVTGDFLVVLFFHCDGAVTHWASKAWHGFPFHKNLPGSRLWPMMPASPVVRSRFVAGGFELFLV